MAVDYFLKIDGIVGDSTAAGFEGAIEVESFSWGASNTGRALGAGGGAARAGKVSFQDLHITAMASKATPLVFQYCAKETGSRSAVLTATESGKTQLNFMTITMSDVLISSFQTGGSNTDLGPHDMFTLNFVKVEVDYRSQNDDGTLAAAIPGVFDLSAGNLKAVG
jgi:type VI secretion system secreted protein Hcp